MNVKYSTTDSAIQSSSAYGSEAYTENFENVAGFYLIKLNDKCHTR